MVNVELTTDGLFFTLGNMMPPLRDNGFVVLAFTMAGMAFDCTTPTGDGYAPTLDGVVLVDDDVDGDADEDVVDVNVVVGSGGSVNSSINEYLKLPLFLDENVYFPLALGPLALTCSDRIRRADRSLGPAVVRRAPVAVRARPRRPPASSIASRPCPNCL